MRSNLVNLPATSGLFPTIHFVVLSLVCHSVMQIMGLLLLPLGSCSTVQETFMHQFEDCWDYRIFMMKGLLLCGLWRLVQFTYKVSYVP